MQPPAKNSESHSFLPVSPNPSGSINEGNSGQNQASHLVQPHSLLQRFARSCCGKTLVHPITKNLAGAILAFGIEMHYMYRQGKNFLGHEAVSSPYADGIEVISIGTSLWCASTLVSTLTLPRSHSAALHILKSMGFAIGGVIYVAWDSCVNKGARDGQDQAENELPDSLHSESFSSVLDDEKNIRDYKLGHLPPQIE